MSDPKTLKAVISTLNIILTDTKLLIKFTPFKTKIFIALKILLGSFKLYKPCIVLH